MKVLIGCEFSGTVRDAFLARGHDAVSCDLLPSESPKGEHYQCDVFEALAIGGWDLLICHPPCTHLAVSGARWFPEKRKEQRDALNFVLDLLNADVPMICLENPVSIISSVVREPDQIIQPWMFGHEETKTTCLWLKNLPKLRPTKVMKRRDRNLTPSGQNKLSPSDDRWKLRAKTYQGIADAMAEQWGELDPNRRDGFGLEFKSNFRKKT